MFLEFVLCVFFIGHMCVDTHAMGYTDLLHNFRKYSATEKIMLELLWIALSHICHIFKAPLIKTLFRLFQ